MALGTVPLRHTHTLCMLHVKNITNLIASFIPKQQGTPKQVFKTLYV